jgi:MFS family permease
MRPRLTLMLLSLSHAVIHAQSALMPLVYTVVIAEFALSASDIGLFIAVTTAVGGVMQLIYGFVNRWMARPALLGLGQLVFGGALVSAGLASSVGGLLASISAARIGASPQHVVGNALLSDIYPVTRRGFAISAHISGGNVGTIIVPFLGASLIAAFGWNVTLALFGLPALLVGVLILLLVREDAVAYRSRARDAGTVRAQLGAVLGRRDLRLILGASLVAAGGRGLDLVAPFMLLYLRGPLGIDEGTTAILYALLLVGAVIGPILAGWLSDRYGRRPTLIAYYLLSAAGIAAFLAAGANLLLLVPLLLPFGTAVFSESPVLQAYLADRAEGPIRDMAFAVYFTVAFGFGAAWAFIMGHVADAFGYPVTFGMMAVSYLAAAGLLLLVRETTERRSVLAPSSR